MSCECTTERLLSCECIGARLGLGLGTGARRGWRDGEGGTAGGGGDPSQGAVGDAAGAAPGPPPPGGQGALTHSHVTSRGARGEDEGCYGAGRWEEGRAGVGTQQAPRGVLEIRKLWKQLVE